MRAATTIFGTLGAVLLASVVAGCAINPVTGRPELTTMSSGREAALGREAAQQVEAEMGFVDDAALQAYVERLGQRLAAHSPRQDTRYEFHVVEMAEPNAFALPGGHIYVSRGLLALMNSEDELANVIGHEIGHVAARHAAQRDTRATGVGILATLGTLAAAVLAGGEAAQAVGQLSQVAGAGYIAAYSRDQERDADEIGQALAAASGYDPAGMSRFLATLEGWTQLEPGGARRPSFLDTHPATPERVADTKQRAARLETAAVAPVAPTRAAFLGELAGLRVGQNVEEGVFDGTTFLHPGLDLELRFPEGWRTRNQRTAVVAGAPEGDALLGLELQGPGADPRSAASAFAQRNGLRPAESAAFRASGGEGFYFLAPVPMQQGEAVGWIGFVAYEGRVYRVTGLASPQSWRSRVPTFAATAASLGPLSSAGRRSLRDQRLRIVRAGANETLAALAQRAGNAWSVQQTAVANGLAPEARLEAGWPVKVVIAEPLSTGAAR